jgi:hypothetical protein
MTNTNEVAENEIMEDVVSEDVTEEISEEEIVEQEIEESEESDEVVEETIAEAEEDEDDDDEEEEEEGSKPMNASYKKKVAKEDLDVQEHIDAMLSGQELSEEFQEKAKTIFEAAVLEKVNQVAEELESEYNEEFEKSVLEVRAQIAEKVDEYLSYVAKEWLDENKVAVENSLKLEIMENFVTGLKGVFTENYIDVPEEKMDLYQEALTSLQENEESLNDQIEKNVKLTQQIESLQKESVIRTAVEGLTLQQSDKIRSLSEGVEFTTEEEYAEKINIIKENYFPAEGTVSEDVLAEEEVTAVEDSVVIEDKVVAETMNPIMESYVRSLSRFSKK